MATTVSAVIERREAGAGKPSITYRYAGDRGVLVEYGEMEFDLTLNFFVLAVDAALRARQPDGVVETAPGFRSILVGVRPCGRFLSPTCSTTFGRCTTLCRTSTE